MSGADNVSFEFVAGDKDSPLLISVPHDGRGIPEDIAAQMSPAGLAIPDTDWHVARLYEFFQSLGAHMLIANYSRYVVDLNRSAADEVLYPGQVVTGLCPERTFAGDPIYAGYQVSPTETARRVDLYWRPYHEQLRATLDDLKRRHGIALLWDAHSIPGTVPRLFDGDLPLLNLGSNECRSTSKAVATVVFDVARRSRYASVLDGRFKGGYITRHYGAPANDIHALQLEIAQRAYMDETTLQWSPQKAEGLRDILRRMVESFQSAVSR